MGGVRIPHDLNGEDRFILGLSVSRVAVLLFGTLAGYTVLHLPWPLVLRLPPALLIWVVTAAFVWLRWKISPGPWLAAGPAGPLDTLWVCGKPGRVRFDSLVVGL